MIVVGTALATLYAKQIVTDCLNLDTIPVIEINLESCIDVGYLAQVNQKSEDALPALF